MLKFVVCLLLSCLVIPCQALPSIFPSEKITHVIYVTLDGVRWQDVFKNPEQFQKLKNKYAMGKFYGVPRSRTMMEVASIPISLPSYQSQMAGVVQPCNGNDCGRIHVTTLPENILEKMHLSKKDVVVFSSWPIIDLAAQHVLDKIYANTGNIPAIDPTTGQSDAMMAKLNQEQIGDHPYGLDDPHRYDKYTFAQALHYLKNYQPRFMWISLCDGDDAAHRKDLRGYYQALTYYDDIIDQLFETLNILEIEKNTLIIITTDHGRGNGEFWVKHGPEFPESKQTWAFVMHGDLLPVARNGKMSYYNTLSIRPTIEAALGIK